MTLTDAMMGAAALWLLFVLCGAPGHRTRGPMIVQDGASLTRSVSGAGAGADIALYSVRHQEVSQPRHVTPPLLDDTALLGNAGDLAMGVSVPENTYSLLGSATVTAIGLPQVLSLTEVTIAPGRRLTLTNLGGSGLIVLEAGWLELVERDGDALLIRSPSTESPASREGESLPTIEPGDRLAFGPGATIVLRNRGEHPARVLAASMISGPGLAA